MWGTTGFYILSSIFRKFYKAVYLFIHYISVALGFDINSSNNVLHPLLLAGIPSKLTKATVGMFAYVMLVPSIPVNLLISKENLYQNRIVSKSNFLLLNYIKFISKS